jgi:hypothetical protein
MTFNNTPTKTKLTHHGSFGGVVEAFCDTCAEAVAFVTYSVSGIDMVITKWYVHPSLSNKEARRAGDLMERELVKEGQKLGVKQLFFIHSDDKVELVRTVEPCVSVLPQLIVTKPTYLYN